MQPVSPQLFNTLLKKMRHDAPALLTALTELKFRKDKPDAIVLSRIDEAYYTVNVFHNIEDAQAYTYRSAKFALHAPNYQLFKVEDKDKEQRLAGYVMCYSQLNFDNDELAQHSLIKIDDINAFAHQIATLLDFKQIRSSNSVSASTFFAEMANATREFLPEFEDRVKVHLSKGQHVRNWRRRGNLYFITLDGRDVCILTGNKFYPVEKTLSCVVINQSLFSSFKTLLTKHYPTICEFTILHTPAVPVYNTILCHNLELELEKRLDISRSISSTTLQFQNTSVD